MHDTAHGMTLIHYACIYDNLEAVHLLLERNAPLVPDKDGRMPSILAAIAKASEELQDYIAQAEDRALGPDDRTPENPIGESQQEHRNRSIPRPRAWPADQEPVRRERVKRD